MARTRLFHALSEGRSEGDADEDGLGDELDAERVEDAVADRARLSTKHTLALTNRGGASAEDLVELARAVRDGVLDAFGVELVPEPVLVGVSL